MQTCCDWLFSIEIMTLSILTTWKCTIYFGHLVMGLVVAISQCCSVNNNTNVMIILPTLFVCLFLFIVEKLIRDHCKIDNDDQINYEGGCG